MPCAPRRNVLGELFGVGIADRAFAQARWFDEMTPGTASSGQSRDEGARAPLAVRLVLWTLLGLLIAGALYLIAVRGEALLVDLSGLTSRIFCL